MNRREALKKLGLSTSVVYTAPIIVKLDTKTNAKVLPSPCPPPHAKTKGLSVRCRW